MAEYTYSNTEENQFWLKLMSIKVQIIYNSLPPDKPEVREAELFHRRFEALYAKSREETAGSELAGLNQEARQTTYEFRGLALSVLKKQLLQDFYINLKPSFVNHIVSMADEYLYLLDSYLQNRRPVYNPVVQDIFWLPAYQVDVRLFKNNVDFFETYVVGIADGFEKRFDNLLNFALTLQGFLRTGLEDFHILRQYRSKMRDALQDFAEFIVDLLTLARKNSLPGTLTLLELECAYRIVCYHSAQLAAIEGETKPPCEPGAVKPF